MLSYQPNGNIMPGIHPITWDVFIAEFGFNEHRKGIIQGLELAMKHLKSCGCQTIYIDGSFVSRKILPNDYDACWDPTRLNLPLLKAQYPILLDLSNQRANQKLIYKGELFPMTSIASPPKVIFMDFFQLDRNGSPKGIIKLLIS